MISSEVSIGEALKTINERLNHIDYDIDEDCQECRHDCCNCIFYVREQSYDQTWGMWQFYNNHCQLDKERDYCIDGCKDYIQGKSQDVYVNKEEKMKTEYMASLGYYRANGISYTDFVKKHINDPHYN